MSPKIQAEYFFNAYQVLRENDEAMIKNLESSPGKPLIGTKMLGTRPTVGIYIVCLAFSVELYIKDVHYALESKAPRGHDILRLFEKLSEQIQQEIFAHHSISKYGWSFDEFKQEIKAISDGFEKWRYSYEITTLRYNIYFALVFIEAIISVADAVRKRSAARAN